MGFSWLLRPLAIAAWRSTAHKSAMRWRDYFLGRKLVLRSVLSTEVVKERIDEASASYFWPFSLGVAGGLLFGRLSLWIRTTPFDYNAKCALTGSVRRSLGGTEFHLRFGPPRWLPAFFVFWYSILTLIIVALTASALKEDSPSDPILFAIIPLLLIAPLAMHLFFARNADEELDEILDFLEREAHAVPVSDDIR